MFPFLCYYLTCAVLNLLRMIVLWLLCIFAISQIHFHVIHLLAGQVMWRNFPDNIFYRVFNLGVGVCSPYILLQRKSVFIFKSIQQNNRLAKFHLCGKNWATKSVLLKLSFESFFIFICRSFDKSCFLFFKKSFFIVYLKKLYARNCKSDNDTSCCND